MSDVPDWRPSPIVGRLLMPRLKQAIRRLHVDDLGRTRPTLGAGAADDQDRILVDTECRIVDPFVVILGTVEDHALALEHPFPTRLLEIAGAKILRHHAHLHDAVVEEIAREDKETGTLHHRRGERIDHLSVFGFATQEVLGHGLTGHGATAAIELAV